MKYNILVAKSLTELKEMVNGFIKHGWEPQGGITIEKNSDDCVFYFQAIVEESYDGTETN